MSRYGQRLLKRLTIQYCDHSPGSQGVRQYLEQHLPAFQQANPQVQVETVLRRSRFPFVRAQYLHPRYGITGAEAMAQQQQQQQMPMTAAVRAALRSGAAPDPTTASKTIGLKYQSLLEVRQQMWWLAAGQGRPTKYRIPAKHWVSKQPSIQGAWSGTTWAGSSRT